MISTWTFSQEMLTLYCMAVLGFILRKTNILNKEANHVLTQLILYVTLPALILFSLDISFSYSLSKDFIWLIAMSMYILTLSIMLAFLMNKHSLLPENQKSVYEGIIIFGNQGFIGYAVTFILFGQNGIVYLTVFNLYYLILIWTYGIFLFTKNKETMIWQNLFLNPGILSTLTGLVFLFTPLNWPESISNGLESVGKMTVPLSMILIGCFIANMQTKNFFLLLKNSYLWKSAITKLLIIPFLLLPFAAFSFSFPILAIAVIVSGMPSAPTIPLYAQKYGGDTLFASFGVILTTLLCIITIPLLYFICQVFYYSIFSH